MNAGGEAMLGGQLAEQGDELLALGGVEAGAELDFVLGRGSHDLAEHAVALAGEVQGADTAVAWDRPPLEEAALLEPVDESHHAARRDLQRLSQRLLGLPFRGGDVSQQHHLPWIEIEARHPLPPEARRVEADLGEQEGGARNAQALGAGLCGRYGIRHSQKHTSVNLFMI
jgi:hypothetical protein